MFLRVLPLTEVDVGEPFGVCIISMIFQIVAIEFIRFGMQIDDQLKLLFFSLLIGFENGNSLNGGGKSSNYV